MTDTKQPEALYQEACQIALANPSLATLTRRLRANGHDIGYTDVTPMLERMVAEGVISDYAGRQKEPVEHELRARIAELEAENRALKEQQEAIGAGGVTGLRNQKPTRPGLCAWHSGGCAAIVLVDRRPSDVAPGKQLNGHVVRSTRFYDGCSINDWGRDGSWVLLRDFNAAIAQEGGKNG